MKPHARLSDEITATLGTRARGAAHTFQAGATSNRQGRRPQASVARLAA